MNCSPFGVWQWHFYLGAAIQSFIVIVGYIFPSGSATFPRLCILTVSLLSKQIGNFNFSQGWGWWVGIGGGVEGELKSLETIVKPGEKKGGENFQSREPM